MHRITAPLLAALLLIMTGAHISGYGAGTCHVHQDACSWREHTESDTGANPNDPLSKKTILSDSSGKWARIVTNQRIPHFGRINKQHTCFQPSDQIGHVIKTTSKKFIFRLPHLSVSSPRSPPYSA